MHLGVPEQLYLDKESGESLPYLVHDQHYVKRARQGKGSSFICGDRCVVCAYTSPQTFGLDIEADAGLGKCYPKLCFGVSGWIEEWFHNKEYLRGDGQGSFFRRELCTGKNCEDCKAGWPKVFGRRFYFPFSGGTWKYHIETVHELAERSCKCGGQIYVPSYYCPHCDADTINILQSCDCGSTEVEIDLSGGDATCKTCNRSWKAYAGDDEQLRQRIETPIKCPSCGVDDVLQAPRQVCTTEGCQVDPYSVFDCQLSLKKEGDGEKSKIIVSNWKIQEPDPRLFDPQFQQGDEWAQKNPDKINMLLDVSRVFQPEDPAQVASLIGVPNPFAGAQVSRQVIHYPRDQRVVEEEVVPEAEGESEVAE